MLMPCSGILALNAITNDSRLYDYKDLAVKWADCFVCAYNPHYNDVDDYDPTEGRNLCQLSPEQILDPKTFGGLILNFLAWYDKYGLHCLRHGKCRFHYPKLIQALTEIICNAHHQLEINMARNDPYLLMHTILFCCLCRMLIVMFNF